MRKIKISRPFTFLAGILAALAFSAAVTPSVAGMTIRVLPGPLDGARIQTPWGDYVALFRGDTVWVGTQREYDAARAVAIMRDNGGLEFCGRAEGHCGRFVEADLPRLSVGSARIAGITFAAAYEVDASVRRSRPKVSPGTEFAEVTWEQEGAAHVRPLLIDRETKASFSPYFCGVDVGIHHCDFKVPAASLHSPAALAFLSQHEAPAMLPAKSLAWLAYSTITQHVRSLTRSGIPVNPDDPDDASYRDVARLHEIDPSVPVLPGK